MSFSFNINDKVLVRKTDTDIWALGTYKGICDNDCSNTNLACVELSIGGFTAVAHVSIKNIYPYNLEYKYLLNTNKTPHTFKKGDVVLVRDYRNNVWEIAIYASIGFEENNSITYGVYRVNNENNVIVDYYSYCIPFNGNEHLAYIDNEPDNYDFRINTIISIKE